MLITVEATYESGALKLHQPLPLDEHETVRVTVETDRVGPTGSAVEIPHPRSSAD
jgi:predicted DNA-binding antitoxin AbrB/MazE fold protein